MNSEMILQPVLAMIVLTAIVWVYLYARRIPAMKKAGKPVQAYTIPERASEFLPEEVNFAANNFKNLFELPVLFYALCLFFYVTGQVDAVSVTAAWIFVGFRVLHSVIHCTFNIVMLRFYLYLGGALALWFMLGRAIAASLGA